MATKKKKTSSKKKTSAPKLPSAADIAKARAKAIKGGEDYNPGHARGVDRRKWYEAVIDLEDQAHNPERIESARAALKAKGYAPVDGDVDVDGFGSAELWLKERTNG